MEEEYLEIANNIYNQLVTMNAINWLLLFIVFCIIIFIPFLYLLKLVSIDSV